MWPCYRLVIKRWLTLTELETMCTRERVIELNEVLDALEEAQEDAEPKKTK